MNRLAAARVLFSLVVFASGTLAAASQDSSPPGPFLLDGGDEAGVSLATTASAVDPCTLAADEPAPPAAQRPLATRVASLAEAPAEGAAQTPRARPMAFEYSDGYRTRLKIHKWASYGTLPLFAAQFVVGQKLYNGNGTDSTRSLHKDLVGVTVGLFGVNTVTGVWNMLEARKDPNHKTKRTVHGLLMIVADAGFVATGLTAPHRERLEGGGLFDVGGSNQSTHRALAIGSMGVATVAYLMMLLH